MPEHRLEQAGPSSLARADGEYRGPIVDAHHHLWDLGRDRHPWLRPGVLVPHRYGDYSAIKRNYLVEDYLRDIAGHGVVASVFMEAEWVPGDAAGEVRFIEGLSEHTGVPGAMAAQAWLDAEDAAAELARLASSPLVRSVRHKPAGPSSPSAAAAGERTAMSEPAWRRGYALLHENGLHFELQTPWWNLYEAVTLARDFPETLIIVNHAGVLQDRSQETVSAWRSAMEDLALRPNVVVKASGLCVPGEAWSVGSNRGVVLDLVRMFGSDRVMFGSNFPVDRMFVSFGRLVDGFRQITAGLGLRQQQDIFHRTAERVYRPRPIVSPD